MSFWSQLARYGLMAAPYVAAPYTGGASLALIGAASGAGQAALAGGGAGDVAMGAGMGALPYAIQAGASGGSSTLQNGGVGAIPGTGTPPPPQPTTGFWSQMANQARQGLSQRDTYTTAARAIAGAIAAQRANRPSMQDVQTLEYINSGGTRRGRLGLTRPTTARERSEARDRLNGPGFWSQFLDYGVAPGLAVYGSMLPRDQGR